MTNEGYLDGLANGDDVVIERIFSEFKLPLINLLKGKGAPEDVAEDIFMATLGALYQYLLNQPLILTNCTFQTYLAAVCLKQWYKCCRRNKFKADITPEELSVLKDNYDLEAELVQAERSELIWDSVQKLSGACRQILELTLREKLSLRAVGEAMGYTYDFARKKKSQCQRKLIEIVKADPRYREMKD